MNRIVLIIPYLGTWPFWLDAYLLSVAKNPTIDWIFITDCEIPSEFPKNVKFIKTTKEEFNARINVFFNTTIPLSPRKICDLRPAFGNLFAEHLRDYEFWGFCDMDIVWGNIRKFITQEVLSNYDIISSRKHNTSGHFTILRNIQKVNDIYTLIPDFKGKLAMPKLQRMDENILTDYLRNEIQNRKSFKPRIKWNTILCNQENGRDSHQEYYLDRWLWQDGKMLNTKTGEEVMYLHFINWKRTMKYCEVKYSDAPNQFYISYSGMHYKLHSKVQQIFTQIKNVFNGYEKRMARKRLVKRIKRKINI